MLVESIEIIEYCDNIIKQIPFKIIMNIYEEVEKNKAISSQI